MIYIKRETVHPEDEEDLKRSYVFIFHLDDLLFFGLTIEIHILRKKN